MVEAGLCDALASDYFCLERFEAIDRLDRVKFADGSAFWSLPPSGSARAMRLNDHGSKTSGSRADLVLMDWTNDPAPVVRGTWISGRAA